LAGPHFPIEVCDAGRLLINGRFRRLLEANRLTTFAALFNFAGGEAVRTVGSRSTMRITLKAGGDEQTFFLKRHSPPRLIERLKPLFHLSRPIVGARNEWEAILRFHACGLPTMTPVAFGELQGHWS
jgi:heptose I phosphotransferase